MLQPAGAELEHGWKLKHDVQTALDQGKPMQAIRALWTARQVVARKARPFDATARSAPARPGSRDRSGLAPGEVPRSRFGGGSMIVVVLVAAALIWLLLRTG